MFMLVKAEGPVLLAGCPLPSDMPIFAFQAVKAEGEDS